MKHRKTCRVAEARAIPENTNCTYVHTSSHKGRAVTNKQYTQVLCCGRWFPLDGLDPKSFPESALR